MRAIDVARFFLSFHEEKDVSNMKLNKLVYYAQAWSLARNGKALFDEDVQAWQRGPVIPEVYHEFKRFGSRPISENREMDYSEISEEDFELLMDVARSYLHYSPSQLVELTHRPGSPWSEVYRAGVSNIVIPKESMKNYYLTKTLHKFHDVTIESVGYRDSEGVLVLPKEYDDATEEMGNMAR